MCGRFEIHSTIEMIATVFDLNSKNILFDPKPNYNVAPSHDVPVVRQNGERTLSPCRWGFLPSWAKEEKIAYKMINARAETVAEKRSFKKAFVEQRCLIVADGFYEWRTTSQGKQPIHVRLRSQEPFGFAGLYNVWHSPEGKVVCTCTIIVTDANKLLQPIHDRMPVILPKANHAAWLDPDQHDTARLLKLLKPYKDADLELYDVDPRVNSPKNNFPDLIKPIV